MCYSTTQDITEYSEIITEGGMNDFQEGGGEAELARP